MSDKSVYESIMTGLNEALEDAHSKETMLKPIEITTKEDFRKTLDEASAWTSKAGDEE